MSAGDEPKKDDGRGFGGLAGMVSNVETSDPKGSVSEQLPAGTRLSTARASTANPKGGPGNPEPSRARTESRSAGSAAPARANNPLTAPLQELIDQLEKARNPPQDPQPRAAEATPISAGGKWLLGIGAVVALVWLWAHSGADKEVMPEPGGGNRTLGASEIRYCLSEDIRIDAAKRIVNSYAEWEVNQINQMVSDYNARCGMYKYSRGTLESVQASVEKNRAALEAEGRARIR